MEASCKSERIYLKKLVPVDTYNEAEEPKSMSDGHFSRFLQDNSDLLTCKINVISKNLARSY